ncbi:MAG: hypothetical protein GC164_10660 [Phycisphaera sp.]|nr:hypothetical protein [Phycisphaera sp.]
MSPEFQGQPDSDALTWSVLLGNWIEFARSAVALPENDEGHRWRASVADLIALQAVWFALGQLDRLDPVEVPVALDKALVLIDRHATALESRWGSEQVPAQVRGLIGDAREQWHHASSRSF